MKKVVFHENDIDRHGEGCSCGLCSHNGKSYGIGVYEFPEGFDDSLEEELNDYISESDPIEVVYAPSFEVATEIAIAWAENAGYSISGADDCLGEGKQFVINKLKFNWERDAYVPGNVSKFEEALCDKEFAQGKRAIEFIFEKEGTEVERYSMFFKEVNDEMEDKDLFVFSSEDKTFALHFSLGTFEYFGWFD